MSSQYFSRAFAKQFRNGCELYFPRESKYGNLIMEQFAANNNETDSIGKIITDKLYNTHLIYQIVIKMAKQDIPAARTLYNRIIEFHNEYVAYIEDEPYTANHYSDIISTLDSFAELIIAFRKDIVEKSSVALVQYYADAYRGKPNTEFENFSLEPVKELADYYLLNMLQYYNYLIGIWQYETNNGQCGDVTTHTAEYLQSLMELAENLLICLEDSCRLFEVWETKMNVRDQQELYN